MSIKTVAAPTEASSSGNVTTGAKVADVGKEETKEERRARKAAKRAAKALQSDTASAAPSSPMIEAGPSSAPASSAVVPKNATLAAEKKSKKDKKRKRTEDAGGVEITPLEGVSDGLKGGEAQPGTVVVDELDEKRARKAARKATKAAARSAAVGGPPPEEVEAATTTTNSSEGAAVASELSEPARKAIEYVKSHAATLLSEGAQPAAGQQWKFNKANQNWLIRNVWNESEVPEEHVDAVMKYLNTIKAGGRTALIDMAEKCLAAATTDLAESPSAAREPATGSDDTPTNPAAPAAAAAAVVVAPPTPVTVITPEEAKRDREMIKARAEKLLLLLRA